MTRGRSQGMRGTCKRGNGTPRVKSKGTDEINTKPMNKTINITRCR